MDQARWTAVKNNDSTADGVFYYAVKTTGIFCLPSCKSKLPLEENVVFFDTFDQAVTTGFRPCKRCRPDLYPHYAPNDDLLSEIKDYLDKHAANPHCLDDLDTRFGMSSFHLVRIFKKRFDATPREYVQTRRLEAAKNLLLSPNLRTVDIALSCGFSSYTTFYTNFKKATGITPDEYRKGGTP